MTRHPYLFALRHVAYAAAATLLVSVSPGAQSTPSCTTPEACAQLNQIWGPAAQIHEIKNQFVGAVRQLTEALAGTYGDEGRAISSNLESMERIHLRWEGAIASYEAVLSNLGEGAERHVALGTVYLDRGRVDDALRELEAAIGLDARRADVHSLSALAYGLGDRAEDAVRSLSSALALDSEHHVTHYNLALHLARLGRADEATRALQLFNEREWKAAHAPGHAAGGSRPFERAGLLRQTAGVAPIFPLHAYRQGFTRLFLGDHGGAIAEFKRAAASDPLIVDAAAGADEVLAGATALRRGDVVAAMRRLEAAVQASPNRSEAHRALGLAYWADGQDEQSIAELKAAIALAPQDERARTRLAEVLAEVGRTAEAEQVLAGIVNTMPDSGRAHYHLGRLYQSQSLLPRAVDEFELAATFDPIVGLDSLYDTIGGLYANQANFERASDAYVKRINVNPNNAEAHRKLAEIYFLQGRDEGALAECLTALLIDPKSPRAYAGASQALVRMGRFADAVEAARPALALDEGNRDARYALATSLMRLGHTEEGKKELETFQRLQADAMASTERRSELNAITRDAARSLSNGDFAAAATLIRKALTYDPTAASLHRDLGLALVKVGQPEEAIAALDRSIELQESAEAHQLLANAYAALARTAESQAHAASAIQVRAAMKAQRLKQLTVGR